MLTLCRCRKPNQRRNPAPYIVGMNYFKASLALFFLTVINCLVVTFAPLSNLWKNMLNWSVLIVCVVFITLLVRQIQKEEREMKNELR